MTSSNKLIQPLRDDPPVLSSQIADGVSVITYNRPAKGNAFDKAVVRGIVAIMTLVDADRLTRAAIITGRGNFFCSAAKFDEMLGPTHPSKLGS